MIARPRPVFRPCEGLTALETAAVLFITAIVAVPLLAIAAQIVALPVEWQANMEAARDAREILRQVADDARQASCFQENMRRTPDLEDDPETSSTYWMFTWVDYANWVDYGDEKPMYFVVEYYVEDNVVVREVREESVSNVMDSDVGCTTIGNLSRPPQKIGPVAYFDIGLTPIPGGRMDRCIVHASVRPSRPEDALTQDIAAMMRPDNAQCEQPPR